MNTGSKRQGAVALTTALMLVVLIGILACAFDIGWIVMTKTQLHAAADSAALAGGTELLPGLGVDAYKTPAEIETAASNRAIEYAAENRAGGKSQVYVESGRDIQMGTGYFNTTTNQWDFVWGATPYNAVQVTPKRNVEGGDGDEPLPLFFAPILGRNQSGVSALATAVILPASSIRIPPGSGVKSGLSPFAFSQARWKKYWRARQHFTNNNLTANDLSQPNGGHEIPDPEYTTGTDADGNPIAGLDENGNPIPLYYEYVETGNSGNFTPRQLFGDKYRVVDPESDSADNIVRATDGVLEANIYPLASESGNFGTVDVGGLDNSTAVIKRQITDGITAEDMAAYEDNRLDPSEAAVMLQGDTGVSGGIQSSLEEIIGQCRGIVLYTSVSGPGNNAMYTIVEIVGVRIMDVQLTGSLGGGDKVLVIQPCAWSDPAAEPDDDEEIDEETSFFTPLILAQ